jgi:sarcosine oxidase, subunit beta
MNRNVETVILGAGIIGSSVAFHLASRGAKNILVLERDQTPLKLLESSASTARATGGFRAQYGTEINTRLSLLARQMLLEFEDITGVDPGYEQSGYIFMAQSEADLLELRGTLEVHKRAGLMVSREVSVSEIAVLNPALNLEGVLGGTFCPWDGFVRPVEIARGFRRAAERLGVRFEYGQKARLEFDGARVAGAKVSGARVSGVRTRSQFIACERVVNATGAWAAELTRESGFELPVVPVRRQVAATVPTNVLPENMPMSIFVSSGFHLRVRDGRVLLLLPQDTPKHDPYNLEFEASWLEPLLSCAHARVPVLKDLPIDPNFCWVGLYEMSPDHHALLGRAPNFENLFLINGSSGHGVMHSSALGMLLAQIVLELPTSLEAHVLRPERFLEHDPILGSSLL